MKKIMTILLLISHSLYADDDLHRLNFEPEVTQELSPQKIHENPEIHQFDETLLYNMDKEKGVPSGYHFTGQEKSRLSFALLTSSNYEKFSELIAYELSYSKRMDDYSKLWWGAQLRYTQGEYRAMGTEKSDKTRGVNKQTMTSIGLGAGFRFRLLTDFNSNGRFFEHLMSYFNYLQHKDQTDSQSYSGYGMNSEYGFFYRTGQQGLFGLKLTYHLNSVARKANGNESLADRSLVLSFVSLGLEYGYYF